MNIKYYKFQISKKSNSAWIFNSQVANGKWVTMLILLRMQNKVVTMTFSSNYSGQDPKEGTRSDKFYFSCTKKHDIISVNWSLMNTWSAGASALQVTNVFLIFTKNIFTFSGARYNCAGTFDERTCECECKGEMFQDMEKVEILRSKYPQLLKCFLISGL